VLDQRGPRVSVTGGCGTYQVTAVVHVASRNRSDELSARVVTVRMP
jgi:hypothetical protein